MKSMKIAMMALMVLLSTTANAQQEVFQKYQDCEGVTTVHVPKFLMKIAGRFDSNAKKFTDRVSDIHVMTCDNKKLATKIKQDALAAYRTQGYEEMLRVKEDNEQVRIYQRPLKGGKSEYTLMAEGVDLAIIKVVGRLSIDELKSIEDMFD